MKNYEWFNELEGKKQSAEEQAVGMIIADIAEEYKIENISIRFHIKKYLEFVEWLKEERK